MKSWRKEMTKSFFVSKGHSPVCNTFDNPFYSPQTQNNSQLVGNWVLDQIGGTMWGNGNQPKAIKLVKGRPEAWTCLKLQIFLPWVSLLNCMKVKECNKIYFSFFFDHLVVNDPYPTTRLRQTEPTTTFHNLIAPKSSSCSEKTEFRKTTYSLLPSCLSSTGQNVE